MTPGRWQRVGELFHTALEQPGDQAGPWVQSACQDDPEVLAEVLSLLGSHQEAGEGFVENQIKPAVINLLRSGSGPADPPRVGPYRLVAELGRGGMGTVYLAERDDEEYQTQVAIKLVRRGMDTDLILHRFYRERQTLARLQHPHIARLLDGGTTEDGMPYIVMEYVKGSRITDYSRDHRLDVKQRLAVFLDVCDAVSYAHRQFVVHRDLKPGNILVDESGSAKLLDFGICKLLRTTPQTGEQTMEGGPPPLTPDYASPEQIRGEPTTIASDVYSSAAVLYELLTGAKPHRIEEYTLRGIERGICDTEIVRPSEAARNSALARQLRGDLDTILLFALQKAPLRRYGSIEQFADDIRRYLAYQPVKARPDSVLYRLSKFVRRQRALAAAAAAVLLTLSGGVFITARSAQVANENLGLVRQLSNTFVFDVHDAVRDLPGSTRARELIVKTGLQYLDNLSRNARGDATLEFELASAYLRIGDVQGNVMGANLGDTNAALASYRKGLALLDSAFTGRTTERRAVGERITLHRRIGGILGYSMDSKQALASFQQALTLAEDHFRLYPHDESAGRQLAEIYMETSYVLRRIGEYRRALEGASKSLKLLQHYEEVHPEDRGLRQSVAAAFLAVGMCDLRLGRLKEGLDGFRQAESRMNRLVIEEPANVTHHREAMFTYSHIGDVLGNPNLPNLGDSNGAIDAYRRMSEIARRIHEADPADERAKSDYGVALSRQAAALPVDRARAKIALQRQALALYQDVARVNPANISNQTDIAATYNFLGDAYQSTGETDKMIQAYRDGLKVAEPLLPSGNSVVTSTVVLMNRKLGEAAGRRGDRDAAIAFGRRALQISGPAAGNSRPAEVQRYLTPRGYASMGLVYAALVRTGKSRIEDRAEGRKWLEKAIAIWKSHENHPTFSVTWKRELRAAESALESLR